MTDATLLLFRVMVGAFFVLYRFRWVYDPAIPIVSYFDHARYVQVDGCSAARWFNRDRHAKLEAKLMECGYAPQLAVPVAVVELLAGLALILGVGVKLAAAGLLVILVAATWKTALGKIAAQKPVDVIDRVSCYLWLPEPLYIVLCFALLVEGSGAYSIPWFW